MSSEKQQQQPPHQQEHSAPVRWILGNGKKTGAAAGITVASLSAVFAAFSFYNAVIDRIDAAADAAYARSEQLVTQVRGDINSLRTRVFDLDTKIADLKSVFIERLERTIKSETADRFRGTEFQTHDRRYEERFRVLERDIERIIGRLDQCEHRVRKLMQ